MLNKPTAQQVASRAVLAAYCANGLASARKMAASLGEDGATALRGLLVLAGEDQAAVIVMVPRGVRVEVEAAS